MRSATLKLLMVMGLFLLAGCGFQLRQQQPLPFNSAYVDAAPGSPLAALLDRQLARRSKLAPNRNAADVIIKIASESQKKSILTLTSAGKVSEYRLTSTATVSAIDQAGEVVLPPATLQQIQDFSYSDQRVLASASEEAMLREQMNQAMLQQIMRRLAFVKKP